MEQNGDEIQNLYSSWQVLVQYTIYI